MNSIVNLSTESILTIAEAASRAESQGKRFRIVTETVRDGNKMVNVLKYKVGEGMWSLPHYDQQDPYRDAPLRTEHVWLKD